MSPSLVQQRKKPSLFCDTSRGGCNRSVRSRGCQVKADEKRNTRACNQGSYKARRVPSARVCVYLKPPPDTCISSLTSLGKTISTRNLEVPGKLRQLLPISDGEQLDTPSRITQAESKGSSSRIGATRAKEAPFARRLLLTGFAAGARSVERFGETPRQPWERVNTTEHRSQAGGEAPRISPGSGRGRARGPGCRRSSIG